MQEIAEHRRDARLHAVEDGVVAGELDEVALHFEPDDARLRHARRQAQHRRPGAATDIENGLVRRGRDRRGENNRIDRHPISGSRLPQPDATAEQAVLGQGGCGFAHEAASPGAVISVRARQ